MDISKLQILLLIIQIISVGLIVFLYKKTKDLMSEYHKNLINSHNYEMKLLKIIEKHSIENTKIANENFKKIKEDLNELNQIEEIK